MMRYFYGLCFLFGFTGLPVQAKWTVPARPATAASSKALARSVLPRAVATTTSAKKAAPHRSEVIVTQDISRAAAAVAAREQDPALPPARTEERASFAEAPLPTSKGRSNPSYPAATMSLPTDGDFGSPTTRLARVTAYWAAEGDYYTGRRISATGVRLHDGLCAVDPTIIPYGSVVEIAGIGKYLAVDTGSAVIARLAAREGGQTSAERNAIVVDLFFESRRDGQNFAAAAAKYTAISWWTPMATNTLARVARSLFAEEDWLKIESKQL